MERRSFLKRAGGVVGAAMLLPITLALKAGEAAADREEERENEKHAIPKSRYADLFEKRLPYMRDIWADQAQSIMNCGFVKLK